MVDIVLAPDDVTIFAPPEVVEVQVDIGPQGTRGSKFFVGTGNPNSQTSNQLLNGQPIILSDIYVNASPGNGYGYLYQYVSQPGGNTWVQVLNINPTIYSKNYSAIFTTGDTQILIPLNDIILAPSKPIVLSNINVKYSIVNTNPTASSMELAIVGSDLQITLHALKYSSSTWSALTGTVDVHLQIALVDSVI